MSTVSIRLTDVPVPAEKTRRTAQLFLKHFAADARNTPRYLVRYSVVVLALIGLIGILDAHGDGPIPYFVSLLPTKNLDPNLCTTRECAEKGVVAAERWKGLSRPLKILHQVNPEIAKWLQEQNSRGAIVYSDSDIQSVDKCLALAKYDTMSGKLTINRLLFAEHQGNIAVILAHEFRHSRQSYPKLFRYTLSFLFCKGGDPSIVENDAEIYEQEAKNAIFGQ